MATRQKQTKKRQATKRTPLLAKNRFNLPTLIALVGALSIVGYFVLTTFASMPDRYDCPKGANIQDAGFGDVYGPLRRGPKARIKLCRVHGMVVNRRIAADLNRMVNTANLSGVKLTTTGFYPAYRTFDMQQELRVRHNCPSFYQPPNQCKPITAVPGTSNHEMGEAIDFANSSTRSTKVYRWLAANAYKFGFYNLPSESWHWSRNGR